MSAALCYKFLQTLRGDVFFQQLLADKQSLSCDNPAATHFVPSSFCSHVANLVISQIII